MMMEPARNWIDLGDWGTEMDEFKLPASDELSGKELTLHYQSGHQSEKYVFYDAHSFSWGDTASLRKKPVKTEAYEAIQVAPDIFFVDFVDTSRVGVTTSMVLDFATKKATVVTATLPEKQNIDAGFLNRLGNGIDLSAVNVDIQHAGINTSSIEDKMQVHERTTELVGKRIQYIYGSKRVYEHVYLNERLYTWHCLTGPEAGLADTEFCDYFKVAPDVYLFIWREKIMPTFGLVVINLKEMRSNGKTFGIDIKSGKMMNFTMGAIAEFLNETHYSHANKF